VDDVPCTGDPVEVRICADLMVLALRRRYDGTHCAYDKSSHRLTGVATYTDVPTFCDGGSYVIQAGEVADDACLSSPPVFEKTCDPEDGGT
jgi:hypothetical protein